MPLPVLPHSTAASPADLVRLFHQSELDWSRHLGDETTLDAGTWISNPSLPEVLEANCFADARLLPGVTARQLVDEVQARSLNAGAPIRQWRLNPSAPLDRTEPVGEYLQTIGWVRAVEDILLLRHQQPHDVQATDLTVIPARAGFAHYRKLMEQSAAPDQGQAIEAAMLHLDDSHFDAILAIKDKQPIATIGVLTSGEVGTLRQWFVASPQRGKSVGRFILNRMLDFSGRAGLRHVMIAVRPDSPAARLLKSVGFAKVGEWISFGVA